MKLFIAVLSAALFASLVVAHPHQPGHGPHHHDSSSSSESNSNECDCGKPTPPPPPPPPAQRPEWEEFVQHLKDFAALYPIDEIKAIIGEHLNDEELQNTIAFVRSDEFEDLVEQIKNSTEAQAVAEYLMTADWPWAKRVMRMAMENRHALRFARRSAEGNETEVAGGGLDGLIDDIIAVLPKEDLRALFEEKMENSDVFRAVIEIVTSEELRQLLENVRNSEDLAPVFARIEENGIHGEKIRELVRALFGW